MSRSSGLKWSDELTEGWDNATATERRVIVEEVIESVTIDAAVWRAGFSRRIDRIRAERKGAEILLHSTPTTGATEA